MTALLGWTRLSFRIQRWEVLAAAAGTALLVATLLWIAWQLHSLSALAPDCSFFYLGPGCEAVANEFLDLSRLANRALQATGLVPLGMGVLLGVPIVAREVEQGTAGIAWSLTRSRRSWLLRRTAFAAVVLVALLAVVAGATELLASAAQPENDMGGDFSWYGQRGELLLIRGLVALGIGLVVGAVVGRLLPALLVAGFGVLLAFGAFGVAMDRWLETEAEVVRINYTGETQRITGFKPMGWGTLTPSGEILTGTDLVARGITTTVINEAGDQFASIADMRAGRVLGWDVQLVIPGERYREIVLRESAILGGVVLLLLAGGLVVVRGRRPY